MPINVTNKANDLIFTLENLKMNTLYYLRVSYARYNILLKLDESYLYILLIKLIRQTTNNLNVMSNLISFRTLNRVKLKQLSVSTDKIEIEYIVRCRRFTLNYDRYYEAKGIQESNHGEKDDDSICNSIDIKLKLEEKVRSYCFRSCDLFN